MPSLAAKIDPNHGPIIQVGVLRPGQLAPPAASAPMALFSALVDTGATRTCVSARCAAQAGLFPIVKTTLVSATHTIDVRVYLGAVCVPFGNRTVTVDNVQLLEFECHESSPFQILFGRDIICKGHLTISFDGHMAFSL